MTHTTRIIAAHEACKCEHCGRPLKIGVETDTLGIIGADCLNAMVIRNTSRWNGGKPGASWLRDLAKLTMNDGRRNRMGLPERAWSFEVAA